jgi:hypothetical protein
MILALLALACAPKGQQEASSLETRGSQGSEILETSYECDVEAGEWSFRVLTSGWSAGMRLWMALDPETWERHTGYSVGAAADGSEDELAIELDVVADWRDAADGSRTRFRCQDEEALAFQISTYDREGALEVDCLRFGVEGVLDQIDEVSDCEASVEEDLDLDDRGERAVR